MNAETRHKQRKKERYIETDIYICRERERERESERTINVERDRERERERDRERTIDRER